MLKRQVKSSSTHFFFEMTSQESRVFGGKGRCRGIGVVPVQGVVCAGGIRGGEAPGFGRRGGKRFLLLVLPLVFRLPLSEPPPNKIFHFRCKSEKSYLVTLRYYPMNNSHVADLIQRPVLDQDKALRSERKAGSKVDVRGANAADERHWRVDSST